MASKSNVFKSISNLLGNPKDLFLETSAVLIKLGRNIIDYPNEPKYRRLPVGGKTVEKHLLPVDGAMECLFDMGFQEAGDFFVFSDNSKLDQLNAFTKQLEDCRRLFSEPAASSVRPAVTSLAAATSSTSTAGNFPTIAQESTSANAEKVFYGSLQSCVALVKMYENPDLQRKALLCIPVERLRTAAKVKVDQLASVGETVGLEEMLLLELLSWFKREFFRWMDKPECCHCRGATVNAGNGVASQDDLAWGGNRVELYRCSTCNGETRFVRYNHPEKLLETRVGRCGEWANCFTLCCRAMGLEARYVLDWTDHVWTEVFSPTQQRWLHADSTEMLCDKPLTYEAGWNKSLTYVVAFSHDDIQDVTWRYTAKQNEVLARRKLCREAWLVAALQAIRTQLHGRVSEERRQLLVRRLVIELAELMGERRAAEGEELAGRTSGSLEWRLSRAEASLAKAYTIRPSQAEAAAGCIQLRYCSVKDVYSRPLATDDVALQAGVRGWQAMVFESRNVFRKEEHDWKFAYLARTEGSSHASISWQFDLQGSGAVIERVEVKSLESKCYEGGEVTWQLVSSGNSRSLPSGASVTSDFAGCVTLTLQAELRGGRMWQHTQLFRQSMTDTSSWQLDICVYLQQAKK